MDVSKDDQRSVRRRCRLIQRVATRNRCLLGIIGLGSSEDKKLDNDEDEELPSSEDGELGN